MLPVQPLLTLMTITSLIIAIRPHSPLSPALACVNLLRNIAASLLSLKTQNMYDVETSTWRDVEPMP